MHVRKHEMTIGKAFAGDEEDTRAQSGDRKDLADGRKREGLVEGFFGSILRQDSRLEPGIRHYLVLLLTRLGSTEAQGPYFTQSNSPDNTWNSQGYMLYPCSTKIWFQELVGMSVGCVTGQQFCQH